MTAIFNRGDMKERRRRLRKRATPQERKLHEALRRRQLGGYKFRFEPSIGHYVVDFYCAKERLVVEIDGEQHHSKTGRANDEVRTAYLNALGIRVIRFTNRQIDEDFEAVLASIVQALRAGQPGEVPLRAPTCS